MMWRAGCAGEESESSSTAAIARNCGDGEAIFAGAARLTAACFSHGTGADFPLCLWQCPGGCGFAVAQIRAEHIVAHSMPATKIAIVRNVTTLAGRQGIRKSYHEAWYG